MAGSNNEICTMRIELTGSDPLIWRQVEVPTSMTLLALHKVIQAAMGWFDDHLWEFTIRGRRYGLPTDENWGVEPPLDARWARLRSLLVQPKTVMTYVYDFGDDWEHRLVLSNIREGDPEAEYPRFVAGERNAPPEDCGGLSGFYEKLEIMADPQHPEHAEVREWLADYDPGGVDADVITMELERIARSRRAARERARRRMA
jgi:hypothetical protein